MCSIVWQSCVFPRKEPRRINEFRLLEHRQRPLKRGLPHWQLSRVLPDHILTRLMSSFLPYFISLLLDCIRPNKSLVQVCGCCFVFSNCHSVIFYCFSGILSFLGQGIQLMWWYPGGIPVVLDSQCDHIDAHSNSAVNSYAVVWAVKLFSMNREIKLHNRHICLHYLTVTSEISVEKQCKPHQSCQKRILRLKKNNYKAGRAITQLSSSTHRRNGL